MLQLNQPYARLYDTGSGSYRLHVTTALEGTDYTADGIGTIPTTYGSDDIYEVELYITQSRATQYALNSAVTHSESMGSFSFDTGHPYLRIIVKMDNTEGIEVGRTFIHKDNVENVATL